MGKLAEFWDTSRVYRRKFGAFRGLEMALALRRVRYAATPHTLVTVRVPGLPAPVFLRAQTSDHFVFQSIFVEEELNLSLTFQPKYIVDAGANIGLSAVYLRKRYPGAELVALELAKSNYAVLQENTKPYPEITALHRAVWSHRTSLRVENPQAEHWAFIGAEARSDSKDAVEASDLGALLDDLGWPRIDLLKLDVEGAETEVFSNADAWIDSVRSIAVELHEKMRPGCRQAFDAATRHWGAVPRQVGQYTIIERPRPAHPPTSSTRRAFT